MCDQGLSDNKQVTNNFQTMWKTVIGATLGWGPIKPPGEVAVWAETWFRHTRQQILWRMTCPRPRRWLLVEQVWKPQRRYAQALGSSPEHPKWTEFRVLGCSVLTWPCPFAQSWVITPSGSLPHGTESVTQWNQQGLTHPVSPGPGSQVSLCRWGFEWIWGEAGEGVLHSISFPGYQAVRVLAKIEFILSKQRTWDPGFEATQTEEKHRLPPITCEI